MAELDLISYFARIGFAGSSETTLGTLQALHRLHPSAITFENLDPLMGRRVSLEIGAVVGKLVDQRRGGYCYEQNTLFASVLRSLGYSVAALPRVSSGVLRKVWCVRALTWCYASVCPRGTTLPMWVSAG